MPEVISLVSKSTRLLISLHNEDCEFSITKDRTALLFETAGKGDLTSIHLQLNTDGKLIQSYEFPCHTLCRTNSVRIDAIYPSVFGDSEQIDCVWTMDPSHIATDDRIVYGLQVKLICDGDCSPPTLTKINSVSLTVESATIFASKELLGLSSDFFLNLFYGNFIEKNSGSYCIKEVDENIFAWMINSLMVRKWNITSIDVALSTLILADRFCMLNVHKRMLSFIKTKGIGEPRKATLTRYLDVATRCRDIGKFVSWIFEKCHSSEELTEVAKSCGSALTPHLQVFFRFMALRQIREKREKETLVKQKEALIKENAALSVDKEDLIDIYVPAQHRHLYM